MQQEYAMSGQPLSVVDYGRQILAAVRQFADLEPNQHVDFSTNLSTTEKSYIFHLVVFLTQSLVF